ncbi:MAG: TonB-dependent receptor [Alphaproteobacteria bacterium]
MQQRHLFAATALACVLSAGLTVSTAVQAQDADASATAETPVMTMDGDGAGDGTTARDNPAAASSGPQLDEIVVTAEKRAESLQDVPVSIVALGEQQLEYRGIDELKDFAANIPNLFVNNFTGSADTIRLFIRGLGQNSVEPTQDPSVALYIDGVYVGSAFGSGFELVDLARVEVLRGPQGTLYGRNATGGAINMITSRPPTGEWDFKQSFTIGNFGRYKSKTSLIFPLGDDIGVKVSGLRSYRDGLVENNGPGDDFGVEDRVAGRIDLRWDISDTFSFDLSADGTALRDSAPYEQGLSGPASSGSHSGPLTDPISLTLIPGANIPVAQPVGNFTFSSPVTTDRQDETTSARPYRNGENEVYGVSMVMTWEPSDSLTVKSVTGFRKVNRDNFGDFAPYAEGTIAVGIPAPVLDSFGLVPVTTDPGPIADQADITEIEQWSEEIQFLGEGALFGSPMRYTTGIYLYQDEIFQDATNSTTIEGPRSPDQTYAKNQALAIFAQGTVSPQAFEERLHITLGGRFSFDWREADRINENAFSFAEEGGFTPADCTRFLFFPNFINNLTPCVPNGEVATIHYEKDFANFNPSGTIEYDLTDSTNVYAKVVTGYKTGGTATRSANPENFQAGFEEENVISYELGMKGRFFDGRVELNSALFYLEIDGFQTSVQTGTTPGDRDFIGVDGTKIAGFEMDFTMAVTEALVTRINYGMLYTDHGEESVTIKDDAGNDKTYMLTKRLAYAPRHSGSISLDYYTNIGSNLDFAGYLGFNFQTDMVTSVNQDDTATMAFRGLVDANLSLMTSDALGMGGAWTLSVFGKNLLDKEYLVTKLAAFKFAGVDEQGVFGEPRTFGLSLTFQWGS